MPRKKAVSEKDLLLEEKAKIALSDPEKFIETVQPKSVLGNVHRDVLRTWKDTQYFLLLLPRDHRKSTLAAYMIAYALTKDPSLRILLISSTSNLAIKQLKFIKDILTSENYRTLWPEMVEKEEAKREKWTEREISVDHPKRKEESIREPSIFTAGLTTNIVGLHADIIVMDDVVVASNAYLEAGREKVKDQYGYLSSVAATDAKIWVVGTRYHPLDLYNDLIAMEMSDTDELGKSINARSLFTVYERPVESMGDGTGEFLWPRQQRSDGRWFGFNSEILHTKKLQYSNQTHYRAQYYNDPHDESSSPIPRELFQYYDPKYLSMRDGRWYFRDSRINICAAVDFAYSTGKKSDYTSIVVVGVDGNQNYYVLDIDRFKTIDISEYYKRIFQLHAKWGFRKIRAEVSVAQAVIVKDLKENYIRKNGLALTVEEFRPSRWLGSKEERIMAILQPKYSNGQIWHAPSGNSQLLEEELIFMNPPHDDIKDALSSAIDFALPPTSMFITQSKKEQSFEYHARFGGLA